MHAKKQPARKKPLDDKAEHRQQITSSTKEIDDGKQKLHQSELL